MKGESDLRAIGNYNQLDLPLVIEINERDSQGRKRRISLAPIEQPLTPKPVPRPGSKRVLKRLRPAPPERTGWVPSALALARTTIGDEADEELDEFED